MLVTAFILIVLALVGCSESVGGSMSTIDVELRVASVEGSTATGERVEVAVEVLCSECDVLAWSVGVPL